MNRAIPGKNNYLKTILPGPAILAAIILLTSLILTGCGGSKKTPAAKPSTPPPQVAQPLPSTNIPPSLPQTQSAPTLVGTMEVMATPPGAATPTLATATGCPPPSGWQPHVVKIGDTFFYYEQVTGLKYQEIMRLNCREDEILHPDEIIYLPILLPTHVPFVPQPFPTELPGPTIPPTRAARWVNCLTENCIAPIEELADNKLPGGGPADPGFIACNPSNRNKPASGAWIDFKILSDDQPDRDTISSGSDDTLFACGFPKDARLQARFTQAGNPHSLKLPIYPVAHIPAIYPAAPTPYPTDPYQGVVVFPATCDLPSGDYTLTVTDLNTNQTATTTIAVGDPIDDKAVLVTPQYTTPGSSFDVYVCGYDLGETVKLDFYRQKGQPEIDPVTGTATYIYASFNRIDVTMDQCNPTMSSAWCWTLAHVTTSPQNIVQSWQIGVLSPLIPGKFTASDIFWLWWVSPLSR